MDGAINPFRGTVRLCSEDRMLGFVAVSLTPIDDERGSGWGGRISGSDYLVWGANHERLWLEFDDGERAAVVVRATGILRGLAGAPRCMRGD